MRQTAWEPSATVGPSRSTVPTDGNAPPPRRSTTDRGNPPGFPHLARGARRRLLAPPASPLPSQGRRMARLLRACGVPRWPDCRPALRQVGAGRRGLSAGGARRGGRSGDISRSRLVVCRCHPGSDPGRVVDLGLGPPGTLAEKVWWPTPPKYFFFLGMHVSPPAFPVRCPIGAICIGDGAATFGRLHYYSRLACRTFKDCEGGGNLCPRMDEE